MRRVEASVKGRVQGVNFRYATRQRARQLDLRGWVRNELDGSVQVVAEGPEEDLKALVSFLHHGPPMAWVEAVDVVWAQPVGDLQGFQVRF
jgi:acylphosphatase